MPIVVSIIYVRQRKQNSDHIVLFHSLVHFLVPYFKVRALLFKEKTRTVNLQIGGWLVAYAVCVFSSHFSF